VWPSLALATVGVIAMAAIVGAAAVLLFSTSWIRGLLIGAIVAPTDAAAVSALLHLRGLELRARVAGTLELESGIPLPSTAGAPGSGFSIGGSDDGRTRAGLRFDPRWRCTRAR
jgi:NhaP-type Na+/H+ or K+/H+ antiporter